MPPRVLALLVVMVSLMLGGCLSDGGPSEDGESVDLPPGTGPTTGNEPSAPGPGGRAESAPGAPITGVSRWRTRQRSSERGAQSR